MNFRNDSACRRYLFLAGAFALIALSFAAGVREGVLQTMLSLAILGWNCFLVRKVQSCEQEVKALRASGRKDALTGLQNRGAFAEAADLIDSKGDAVTVLVCDVDGLKWINDTLGHLVGDEVIKRAAEILTQCCPPDAQIFRMGGDEFVALIPGNFDAAANEKLLTLIRTTTEGEAQLRLSIGSAQMDEAGGLQEAIRLADCDMYQKRREKYAKQKEGEQCLSGPV